MATHLTKEHVDIGEPVEALKGSDAIIVVNANVLKFKELYSFLGRFTEQPESEQENYEPYPGLGYAARSVRDIVGVVLFYFVPSIVPAEQLCFLTGAVDPLYRRRSVGARLMTQVLATVRRADTRVALIASLPERDAEPAAGFLSYFGFLEVDREVQYERNLIETELVGEDSRFDACEYKGGDPVLDRAIVELHRRAYRNHLFVADLTDELLAVRLASPNCYYELLFHEKQLIGYASLWIHRRKCYVDSLLVVPQYWGCGASDALIHSVERVAVERGCTTVSTNAREANRAIISLMLRHNCHEVKTTRRFCRRFTGDVADSKAFR